MDDEIPCKLVPNACWRRGANYGIWYIGSRNVLGVDMPITRKGGSYYVAFDPVAFPGATASLEEQMQLEEIKWMMGE